MVFTGRAVYDDGVFNTIAEDVAEQIGMISPFETPLLDALGDAPRSARNVLHEWLEDALAPNTIISSATTADNNANLAAHVGGSGVGDYFQVGDVFRVVRTGEFLQVTATTTNTLSFTRGFAGTSAATIEAGDSIEVVGNAALEGADVTVDTSRPRTRHTNYTQIFKKDIIVSGTVQAVNMLGNIQDEFDYQRTKKTREILLDLERSVINGRLSGNTLGSASAYRTFNGIWASITTNATSATTLSPNVLDDVIENAWNYGASDLDVIVVDQNWKRVMDQWQESRIRIAQTDDLYRRRVMFYESTFGSQRIILDRWMPANSLMVLSSQRIKVMPLTGRSFQYQDVAKTGDSMKGMLLGEYTVEIMNEEGLAKAYLGS